MLVLSKSRLSSVFMVLSLATGLVGMITAFMRVESAEDSDVREDFGADIYQLGAIAYFLDPVADRLESAGLSRTIATTLIAIGAILVFVMWTLIFERLWFFNFVWRKEVYEVINAWESRSERKSWYAKQVRERLLSISREDIHANLNLITTLVALCPLLGLLGTVIGMIKVFSAITTHGVGNPSALAGGISEALITTAAGMAVAIPTLMFYRYFRGKVAMLVIRMEQQALRMVEVLHGDRAREGMMEEQI